MAQLFRITPDENWVLSEKLSQTSEKVVITRLWRGRYYALVITKIVSTSCNRIKRYTIDDTTIEAWPTGKGPNCRPIVEAPINCRLMKRPIAF